MFSSKVILAAEVLLYLEPQRPDIRKQPGREPKVLLEAGSPHRPALLAVLRRLVESRYIVLAPQGKGYLSLVDPAEISVLHLVQLFHGDVCIGEAYDHALTIGRERINSNSCRQLRCFEEQLRTHIRRQLGAMSLAELVTKSPAYAQKISGNGVKIVSTAEH